MATIARIPFTISELQSEIPFELSIGGGGGGGAEVQNYKATVSGFTASEQTLVEGNLDLIFEA